MSAKAKRGKVRRYRENMRRQGLRPLQIWVPNRQASSFAEELQRQVRAIAESEQEKADIACVEAISAAWP
ncbi:antitoxin MazE family protein [Dankookia sp. P2]|uniref:antitoxin MazE family protein n=1 Tax=Dankookia sp. P2 TaxID=3423955 RepID=UPI003D678C10